VVTKADCFIRQVGGYIRATVGPHLSPDEIEECYRALATRALEDNVGRILVVGVGEDHPHSHLAARDALIAMAEIGAPVGFKLAFVPRSDATLNGYRHAEFEARQRGIRAQVFDTEAKAIRWLTEPDIH